MIARAARALALIAMTACTTTASVATTPSDTSQVQADAVDSDATTADSSALDAPPSDVPAADAQSPALYGVGLLEIETAGPAGRTLPTTVWYPIAPGTPGKPFKYVGFLDSPYQAVENAPPAQGPFPLVAFSHGNQGVRQQSVFLTEDLARHGYVVVAPDHVGNTFLDYDETVFAAMTVLRPLDLRAAIDRMLKPQAKDPPWFSGLVDPQRIAVTGHSFGGYTALAVAGLPLEVPAANLPTCATTAVDLNCQALKLAGPPPWNFADPRVKLAIPLAHCGQFGTFGFDLKAMHAVKVPIVLQAATADDTCQFAVQALPTYENLGGPRALVALQGGNHFSYSDLCAVPPSLSPQIAKYCQGVVPDMATAHAAIVKYSLAALDGFLKGDASARALLHAGKDGVVTVQAQDIPQ
jgi:predicted dienelactone hydrolase